MFCFIFFSEFLTSSGGALGLAQPLTLLANSCRASGPRNTLGGMNSPLAFTTATTLSTVSREHTGTCAHSASIFFHAAVETLVRAAFASPRRPYGVVVVFSQTARTRRPLLRMCACGDGENQSRRGATGLSAAFDSRSPDPRQLARRHRPRPERQRHTGEIRGDLGDAHNENTAYFSISRFDVHYQRPFSSSPPRTKGYYCFCCCY